MHFIQILPEWAPNIHPMLVHFPIGLLVIAVLMDLLQWFRPLREKLDLTAVLLYTLGTLGSIAAFWSGRVASETVQVSIQAQTVMSDHDDWALYTMLFFLFLHMTIWEVFRSSGFGGACKEQCGEPCDQGIIYLIISCSWCLLLRYS